jgi:hypothetical protein
MILKAVRWLLLNTMHTISGFGGGGALVAIGIYCTMTAPDTNRVSLPISRRIASLNTSWYYGIKSLASIASKTHNKMAQITSPGRFRQPFAVWGCLPRCLCAFESNAFVQIASRDPRMQHSKVIALQLAEIIEAGGW